MCRQAFNAPSYPRSSAGVYLIPYTTYPTREREPPGYYSPRGGSGRGCSQTSPGGAKSAPVPDVQDHQAHSPRAAGDPGEPQYCGAPASLAGLLLPADDDRPQHEGDRGDGARRHLHPFRGIGVRPNLGLEMWSSGDRDH